jgi:hypothetical protein
VGFFSARSDKPFPSRSRWTADIGPSKFGRSDDDLGYIGRRMDILGRSVHAQPDEPAEVSVHRWINGRSASAAKLRKKPMIAIYP